MSALEAWKQRVAAHREQSHKIRSAMGVAGQDRWEPFASFFKADPHRTDDIEVNRLAQEVTPATTLLDVGAGAGRFALPLALRCKHVTVVEPSPSMGETLRQCHSLSHDRQWPWAVLQQQGKEQSASCL